MSTHTTQGVAAPPPSREEAAGRGEIALRWTVAAVGLAFLVTYLLLAWLRLRYPFELEWMEGASVDHVRWILSGHRLYVAPTLDFIPFLYTPLYYYVCAGVAKLVGVGFLPLRLVSIAASLGCFLLLYLIARRETGSRWAGWMAVGFFAATYAKSGAWWDIGRVDTLMLFLVLAGFALLRRSPRPLCQVAAGVTLYLAFLTKQQALVVALSLLVATAGVHKRRALWFGAAFLLPLLVGHLILNRLHHGWYSYYTVTLPRSHDFLRERYWSYWFGDLLPFLVPMLVLAGWFIAYEMTRGDRERGIFYLAGVVGALAASWGSRLNTGGYVNVLMTMHLMLALTSGIGIRVTSNLLVGRRRMKFGPVACLLALAQFAALVYNPLPYVPTARDLQAGRQLLRTVADLPGDVFIPAHSYLPALVGKRTFAHGIAILDIFRGGVPGPALRLKEEIREAYLHHRFAGVIRDTCYTDFNTTSDYQTGHAVFREPDVFFPVCGFNTRPQYLLLPSREGHAPAGEACPPPWAERRRGGKSWARAWREVLH